MCVEGGGEGGMCGEGRCVLREGGWREEVCVEMWGGGEILFVWKGRYLCMVVTCMVEGLVGAFHTAPND